MRHSTRRVVRAGTACAVASALAIGGVVYAHPGHDVGSDGGVVAEDGGRDAHQHGETAGHLPATNQNISVVSKLTLKNAVPEKIADIGVHNGYAYLAAWGVVTCKYNGVHVVDVRNPSAPKEVAFVPSKEGSYPGEGIQALFIDTPAFRGDILVSNNEKCKDGVGFGGMNIYDITQPSRPTPLAVGFGDTTEGPSQAGIVPGAGKKPAHEIHSVFAWDAGDKAYAIIVDNEEGADVDIVDITNPKKPFITAEYDFGQLFPQIVQSTPANLVEVFLHDLVVKEIEGRFILSASYWDGGYVLADITKVEAPVYIGDSDFANPDPELLESTNLNEAPEGNAHQSEFTKDNRFLIGADEDFVPAFAEGSTNDTAGTFYSSQGNNTTQVGPGEDRSGTAVYVGRACIGDTPVPLASTTSQIAVVVRGSCTFTEKLANVDRQGYVGVVIVNREGPLGGCDLFGMDVQGLTPTFAVSREVGYGLFDRTDFDPEACAAGAASELPGLKMGDKGDVVTVGAVFDGWGYVRLFKNGAGKLVELDTYAIEEAHDPAKATRFGDLSVHEVAVSAQRADLAYLSYYAGGIRVIEIADEKIHEVGRFIDEGGSNFWGIEVFEVNGVEYVAASDRDYGLYIVKYTGTP